jgi:hypothetical protein
MRLNSAPAGSQQENRNFPKKAAVIAARRENRKRLGDRCGRTPLQLEELRQGLNSRELARTFLSIFLIFRLHCDFRVLLYDL